MSDYFKYKYLGKEPITVQEFIDDPSTPLIMEVEEFLIYEGVEGFQNLDYITQKYSKIFLNKYNSEILGLSSDLPILPGTSILLPKDNAVLEQLTQYGSTQFLEQTDTEMYLGRYLDLLDNKQYVRSQATNIEGNGIDVNILNENVSVWIWVRAINKIVDVTPFINNCSTNKGDIGSFNFSLNPIIDIEDIIKSGDEYINYFSINGEDTHYIDFFEKNLQQNDVVFIRFEQLEMEVAGDKFFENIDSLFRENYHLKPEKIWDMIGLIDSTSTNYMSMTTDKSVSVSGRDFMKLLIEDGSYFLPYKFIEGKDVANKFVWGGDQNDDWFKRNFVSGNFDTFFSYEMKSIKSSLEFIINHLSNLGVTPNKLWSAYVEGRKQPFTVLDDTDNEVSNLLVNGVWQIVELLVDDVLDSRVVSGSGLINPDGTLYEFFNNICQKPFVEFWGDCYTDTFDLIVRQPPYTKNAIQEVIKKKQYIEIEKSNLMGYNLDWETSYYSHYQIEPQNNWMGSDQGTFQAIIPIIYMPQYASVFGNKRWVLKDSYVDRVVIYGNESNDSFNTFIESILNDYKFMIETTAYLPFTRRGTITLNGDRRIKKGSFVLNKATNELFMVDSVANNFSASRNQIDRTTTLNVSRGMKTHHISGGIDYVTGIGLIDVPYTYFDIVDAELITKTILNRTQKTEGIQPSSKKNVTTNFGVNDDAFNYFLNREHFI